MGFWNFISVITLSVIISSFPDVAHGIIGYDCGSEGSNVTTISLLTTEECEIPVHEVNATQIKIQLLQLNEFGSVMIRQCKVEVDRSIKRCGWLSHTMDVLNGKSAYIQEVSYQECQRLHDYGTYQIGPVRFMGLQVNQTDSRSATLAGSVGADGECEGSAYSDELGSWTKVVVTAVIKITLQEYKATVKFDVNQGYQPLPRTDTKHVILRSGVHCSMKAGHCLDVDGADTYWDPLPEDMCQTNSYGVLYEGYASKIQDSVDFDSQTVYSIESDDTTFALARRSEIVHCGFTLIRTEHPKLFILEHLVSDSIFKKAHNPLNTDMFTYMNSKFVYVERHIRAQLKLLYRNLIQQQCNLEQKILRNSLGIAIQAPDIFAYHLMRSPGYTSVLAGEVIHIIKCVPVEVKITPSTVCYNQLPVMLNNKTRYLAPQTHILLRQGTQVHCNPLAPVMFHLANSWYTINPKPTETVPPKILKPATKPLWTYTHPGNLAVSGIYSQADLDEFRDHVLFPAERPAMLHTIARGMLGHSATLHQGSFSNLLDEQALEKLATSTWDKMWGKFLIFGNISAGIFGIFIIIRLFKLMLDTVLHGIALHSVFGCSFHLMGAIWDSLTQLLLHFGKRTETQYEKCPLEVMGITPDSLDPPEPAEPLKSVEITSPQGQHCDSPQGENSGYTFTLKSPQK